MKVKVGQEIALQTDKRYVQHIRDYSIGDVYDALVELITNADDSYNRLFQKKKRNRDGGDILIEHREQRKGHPSYIVVRDKAEGMDSEDMETSLLRLGAYSSEAGNRGYMGRGAKDCTALGNLTFESIKDGRYYQCRITHDLKFVLEENGSKATEEQRKTLGIERGNGTSVTLELSQGTPLPRLENLATNLPWHFSLRDILSETSDSKVLLRRMDDDRAKPQRLVYRPPEGELVVDETFDIEGYTGVRARLRIWKAPEPLEEAGPRFERFGLLVKGKRAIHECTLPAEEFKRDPHARRYFGRLDCTYLDQLMMEYEYHRSKGLTHPEENPYLVVDPNRRFGLERRHPFVKALLQFPSERLRALIAKDREQEKSQQREVANQETRSRLSRLAKLAGRFLSEQLDELEELSSGDAVDDEGFVNQGVLIYPTYLNVGVDKERTLTFYVRRSLLKDEIETVTIEADSESALEIHGATFNLRPHHSKDDRLVGTFKVKGLQAHESVVLTARGNGLPTAEALVQVVENTIERVFKSPLEFERTEYSVRQGSRKSIRLFAKYPDLVAEETKVKLFTDDDSKVVVRGGCVLSPITGTNYAEGTMTVEGRTLKSKATITAEVNGRRATTSVKVVDKPQKDPTVPIEFDIQDVDYGNFRARWADHEGKPHLLLISAKHKSLARYLGPADKGFPGQDTPLFRVLLAEIIAESVCRKALTMEAKERPWEFTWADLRPDAIADDVLANLQQRLRQFVADAHSIMLSDQEIKAA